MGIGSLFEACSRSLHIMKITVLTDDKAKKRGFLAEHGLSLFIEYKDCNILFDTGQSDVYIRNAKALQLDLNKTDISY